MPYQQQQAVYQAAQKEKHGRGATGPHDDDVPSFFERHALVIGCSSLAAAIVLVAIVLIRK